MLPYRFHRLARSRTVVENVYCPMAFSQLGYRVEDRRDIGRTRMPVVSLLVQFELEPLVLFAISIRRPLNGSLAFLQMLKRMSNKSTADNLNVHPRHPRSPLQEFIDL